MKIENLRQLFMDELQDLYSGEKQIIDALPKMAEKCSSAELRNAFLHHLEQSRGHQQRLDRIFDQMSSVDREDKTCEGIKGIIKEGEKLIKDAKDDDTRDAGMIAAAQRVEHYEMAGYGTVRTYATLLGHPDWADLLQQTLDEEKQTDRTLSQIADRINVEARAA